MAECPELNRFQTDYGQAGIIANTTKRSKVKGHLSKKNVEGKRRNETGSVVTKCTELNRIQTDYGYNHNGIIANTVKRSKVKGQRSNTYRAALT